MIQVLVRKLHIATPLATSQQLAVESDIDPPIDTTLYQSGRSITIIDRVCQKHQNRIGCSWKEVTVCGQLGNIRTRLHFLNGTNSGIELVDRNLSSWSSWESMSSKKNNWFITVVARSGHLE